jgi:hypothetical protein
VGIFYLSVAVIAAVAFPLTVRESVTFLAQTALRQGTTTTD